jgi:hypothetical protein
MAWQFAPGEILTATNLNAVTIPWNAVCQLSMSATQSISNNTTTTVSWDTEDLDPRGWHTGGAPTVITPTIAGWYEVTVDFEWGSDTDYTRRFVEVQKTGASLTPAARNDIGSGATVPTGVMNDSFTSRLISMNGSSDTLRVQVFQTNTSTGANTWRGVFVASLAYPT